MSLMMLASSASVPKVVTLTGNQTWIAPATLGVISKLVGIGGAGAPGGGWDGTHTHRTEKTYYNGGTPDGAPVINYVSFTALGSAPGNYCEPPVYETGVSWDNYQICHFYSNNIASQSTGAATTGFGKSFPGGVGGPATAVTYENIPAVSGDPYVLSIPSGGSLVITFYE